MREENIKNSVKMRTQQIKRISNRLKKTDEELQSIFNDASTNKGSQHLANAVIFIKKAIEELNNSVNNQQM